MNIRIIERRLETLETNYGLDVAKGFYSINYNSENEFYSAIEDFKKEYPNGKAIVFEVYNPVTGKLGLKGEVME